MSPGEVVPDSSFSWLLAGRGYGPYLPIAWSSTRSWLPWHTWFSSCGQNGAEKASGTHTKVIASTSRDAMLPRVASQRMSSKSSNSWREFNVQPVDATPV